MSSHPHVFDAEFPEPRTLEEGTSRRDQLLTDLDEIQARLGANRRLPHYVTGAQERNDWRHRAQTASAIKRARYRLIRDWCANQARAEHDAQIDSDCRRLLERLLALNESWMQIYEIDPSAPECDLLDEVRRVLGPKQAATRPGLAKAAA